MTTADYGELAGLLIGLWAFGYVAGVMFRSVRRVIEVSTGVGS